MDISILMENTILALLVGVFASYIGGALFRNNESVISGVIALVALSVALVNSWMMLPALMSGVQTIAAFGFLVLNVDLLGWIVAQTGLVLTLIVTLYSISYMDEDSGTSKFFPLLLLLITSVLGLVFGSDLFNLYVFFELLSITSFTLVAFRKKQWDPVEAGIKFLVMSSMGSAMILLGIALVYKDFGQLDLTTLYTLTSTGAVQQWWLPVALFTVGFGIKAAMFPLHTWLPDAHAEAPSGISAMLSGIVIEAGFFVMFRVLLAIGSTFPWGMMLVWFALLTMTAGNIMALTQSSMKRMLAYSSVAQMGYILLGVGIAVAYNAPAGGTGGIFHIVTHAFMKGLAFLCAGAIIHRIGSGKIEDMHGVAWKMPVTGLAFTIAVLSLAGVPPFSGFMSKLLIYKSGIQAATTVGWAVSLIAIFNSVLSLGYYLPAVGTLYSKDTTAASTKAKEVPFMMSSMLVVLALVTIYLGVMPDPVRSWAAQAVSMLQGGF